MSCQEATSFNTNESFKTDGGEISVDVINGMNHLGYKVLDHIYDNDKNQLFSPISLTSALAMATNGAGSETKEEMLNLMYLESDDGLNETYNALIHHFNLVSESKEEYDLDMTMRLANSFWMADDIEIHKAYVDTIKSYYDGDAYSVDFKDPSTKNEMNTWIEDKTENMLKDIINETKEDDVAYLINALYFYGQWASAFNENLTDSQDFTTANGKITSVKMMHQEDRFMYYEDRKIQVIGLPYKEAVMYVFLPKGDLDDLFTSESYSDLNNYIDKLEYERVNLSFPKFKFSTHVDLKPVLQSLGMNLAFDFDKADFSKMIASQGEFAVSQVFQNAIIAVDEEGTEAAAVTVMTFGTTSIEITEPLEMVCDKPFMFLIRENTTQSDLFLGTVQNPNK